MEEKAARRKIEEILDRFTALGYAGEVIELRKAMQVMAWIKWEKVQADYQVQIRNPEGKVA